MIGGICLNDKSQLLRGTLEGCILKIISDGETYGYEIVSKLREYGFTDSTEGTIYPLLTRLEKKDILKSVKKESPLGPQRKYYSLSEQGARELKIFYSNWVEFKDIVDKIFINYGGDIDE
ncbi:transcriptional regulator, PadR family [Clostridiales bacterium oral taxon 876 str. F0540]|nr:transcriptional regulator, PadR family [Clostridiales bacterium oral taxon 876 str. F0540]